MEFSKLQKTVSIALLAVVAALLGPNTALAHPSAGPVHDLLHGFEHPLTGLDHICAMFAVGLFAAQRGRRALWLVPLTFILVMTFGAALGMSGIALPFVEQGIGLSVIILGVLVAAAVPMSLPLSALIVGLFALAHGHAHGTEIPATATGLTYIAGFVAATALLHAAGISVSLFTQRLNSTQLVRLTGATIAACGLYLSIR